jgi:GNAT superfamily N-acetyltransferase
VVEELRVSSERSEIDVALVHRFLSEESYWAKGIPRALVEKSIANSLCFGGFLGGSQIAFARVVSDYATFAYLADVFVLPEHRGKGYSKILMAAVFAHPELQGLRRFSLATRDAQPLYAPYGFTPLAHPETFMERYVAGIYENRS